MLGATECLLTSRGEKQLLMAHFDNSMVFDGFVHPGCSTDSGYVRASVCSVSL